MNVRAVIVDDIDCTECSAMGCKACGDTGYQGAGTVQFCEQDGRVDHLFYVCPCGCGKALALPVRLASEPKTESPQWTWDGNREWPTLTPSVFIEPSSNHWHGWLRRGEWVSV